MPRVKRYVRFNEQELTERAEADNGRVKEQVTQAGYGLLAKIITSEKEIDYRNDLAHLRFFAMCLLDKNGDIVSKQHKTEYVIKHNI